MNSTNLQKKIELILPLIKNNDVAKRHFYEKIDLNWLEVLKKRNVFQPDISGSRLSWDFHRF